MDKDITDDTLESILPVKILNNMHLPHDIEGAVRTLNICAPILEYCKADDPAKVRKQIGEDAFSYQANLLTALFRVGYSMKDWEYIRHNAGLSIEEMCHLFSLSYQLVCGIDAHSIVSEVEQFLKQGKQKDTSNGTTE